jgi:hypothetical protein
VTGLTLGAFLGGLNPLSLKKLVYLDGENAVNYRSRLNPSLGRNFEAMDPLEWLARLSDHIHDPGQHRTLFYGEYSSRVRGCGEPAEPAAEAGQAQEPPRRASPSWGRLIANVYQVDPRPSAGPEHGDAGDRRGAGGRAGLKPDFVELVWRACGPRAPALTARSSRAAASSLRTSSATSHRPGAAVSGLASLRSQSQPGRRFASMFAPIHGSAPDILSGPRRPKPKAKAQKRNFTPS